MQAHKDAKKPVSGLRRGLVRLLKVTGISLALLFILIAVVSTQVAQYYLVDPQVSPHELYHRTWETVRDNYFDKSKLKDWDQWEHKYDHLIKTDEDAIRYAREMVNSLNDPYTWLHSPQEVKNEIDHAFGKTISVGILFTPALEPSGRPRTDSAGQQVPEVDGEGRPVVYIVQRGSPAHEKGVTPGDAVVKIGDKPVKGMSVDELNRLMAGEIGTTVPVTVSQNGVEVTFDMVRAAVPVPVVSSRRLPNGVAYVRIESFSQLDTGEQLEQELEKLTDCTSYVIDMRDNPGGLIHTAVHAAALFLDEGVINSQRVRMPDVGFVEIKVEVTKTRMWVTVAGIAIPMKRPPNLTGGKPVVILTNGGTASAAELFTIALVENGRAYVIGEKTYGKGIGQTLIPVGNGARLRITNIVAYTPKGNWLGDAGITTSNGIVPDLTVVAPANLLYASRNDNQLKAALEYIRTVSP